MSLNSLNRNMLRLTGMSSGMDTTSIVTSLLKIDQMKVDKQFKAKTLLEWKGDAYRDVNLKLKNFREKYMSVLSPATNVFSSSAYNAFKANMVDESMSKYVSISAGSNAQQGSVSINRIEQLATAAQSKSRNIWVDGATPSLDTKLGAELEGGGSVFGSSIEWSTREVFTYWKTELNQGAYDAAVAAYESDLQQWIDDGNLPEDFTVEHPDEKDYQQMVKEFDKAAYNAAVAAYESDLQQWMDDGNLPEDFAGQRPVEADFYQTPFDKARKAYADARQKWLDDGNDIADFDMEEPVEEYRTKTVIKEVSFKINDEEFTFTSDNTINEVISAVNSRSNAGVTMSYSSLTQGFTLTSRSTGADAGFTLENTLGKFFSEPNADGTGTVGGAFGLAVGEYKGQNSIMYIEDAEFGSIKVERSSNSFAIDGIQYTLKQTFNAAGAVEGEKIQFNVERDIEPVFEKIKGFIEGYNALIEELQNLYNQKPNKNYSPLTQEETDAMSEKEAEKWQGFAKEGLLYRDSNIGNLLSVMRGAFYDTVQGAGRSASDIGLRTTAYDYTAGGKITIDEDALRAALMSNPEQVKDVFTKVSNSTDASTKYKESGLVVRLSTAMSNYTTSASDTSIATNSRQLKEATSRLEQLEIWLSDQEDRYWKKFTAMETAMSSLNSQSSWIGNMMGSK